jgi:GTP-binding protein Era
MCGGDRSSRLRENAEGARNSPTGKSVKTPARETRNERKGVITAKDGFVAIIGAPNVGKSTLLNQLLGQKIAITSEKPQTTRHRILGIAHLPGAQLIFLDTPGVHKAKGPLNVRMVEVALKVLGDVDLVVFVADGTSTDNVSDEMILESLKKTNLPSILDLLQKEKLLPLIEQWDEAYPFRTIVPISALHRTQVDKLVTEMVTLLPEGPQYYPEDVVTDVPERFIAAEMIREKVFRLTSQEIPYGVAVTVESFKERSEKHLIDIQATIHVERESQKPMIIGKGGKMLRQIGEQARKDIERMVGCKVFLKLKWTRDEKAIKRFGY